MVSKVEYNYLNNINQCFYPSLMADIGLAVILGPIRLLIAQVWLAAEAAV